MGAPADGPRAGANPRAPRPVPSGRLRSTSRQEAPAMCPPSRPRAAQQHRLRAPPAMSRWSLAAAGDAAPVGPAPSLSPLSCTAACLVSLLPTAASDQETLLGRRFGNGLAAPCSDIVPEFGRKEAAVAPRRWSLPGAIRARRGIRIAGAAPGRPAPRRMVRVRFRARIDSLAEGSDFRESASRGDLARSRAAPRAGTTAPPLVLIAYLPAVAHLFVARRLVSAHGATQLRSMASYLRTPGQPCCREVLTGSRLFARYYRSGGDSPPASARERAGVSWPGSEFP